MKKALTVLILFISFGSNVSAQGDEYIPVIENFETTDSWPWKPWNIVSYGSSNKTPLARHTGKYGLSSDDLFYRSDITIGEPGQVISWWITFKHPSRAHCGFGAGGTGPINEETTFYLCADPSTNTFHFAGSPGYSHPFLKSVTQSFKMNMWYRVEVLFNTRTNVTGKLYSSNGKTLLRSVTVEIPELRSGGIAFRGDGNGNVYVDDIKGGDILPPEAPLNPKVGESLVLKNIVFENNKSSLLPQSFTELNQLANYLKQNPDTKIEIGGHTDNTGTEAHNKQLSAARAKSVADYLIRSGIDKTRILYIGYGSSRPEGTNDTDAGRQKNRRVEFIITKKQL